jgi:cytochrome c oxidase assembly factor CtaG/putative copper export protein
VGAGPLPGAGSRQVLARAQFLGVGLLAVLVFAYLAALWIGKAAPAPPPPGITDAGPVVGWVQALLTPATVVAQVLVVGALLYCSLLIGRRDGMVTGTGVRALRFASWTAAGWAVAELVSLPVSYAYVFGEPMGEVVPARVQAFATDTSAGRGLLVLLVVAAVIAVGARFTSRVNAAAWLLVLGLVGLAPLALGGHAAGAADHDLAVGAVGLHVLGVTVWCGGLFALVAFPRNAGAVLMTAARRYSRTALYCYLAVAMSGIASALLRVTTWHEVVSSGYGRLLVVKTASLLVLGALGALHRRRSLPTLTAGGRSVFVRLAAAELVVMAVAIATGAALARSPAPEASTVGWTRAENIVGYRLSPFSSGRLLTAWRPDVLLIGFGLLALSLYLIGAVRLARRGVGWRPIRTWCFTLGVLLCLYVLVGAPAYYGPAMFSVHMAAHMTLTMLVPILLGLGTPITLALRALPATTGTSQRSMREWLLVVLHSRVTRLLTHPFVALGLYVVTLYGFYFSSLFATAMSSHLGHLLMQAHFLAVGCLFFWVVLGMDPIPRALSYPARLALLVASMPFHAFFGVVVMDSNTLVASQWFQRLQIPWVDVAADQRLGGGIAWSFGEIPILILVVVMTLRWFLSDSRDARRFDRSEARTGDAELSAYNAYLARLAIRGPAAGNGDRSLRREPGPSGDTGSEPSAPEPPAATSRPDG